MSMSEQVVQRLLLCKHLLGKFQSHPVARPDRFFVAEQIIVAHNAAELALSAISEDRGKSPSNDKSYLMDYFGALKQLHPESDVSGRDYFRQLNTVRNNIKHQGLLPDPTDWARVSEKVSNYIAEWCRCYLDVSWSDLDQSALLMSNEVRMECRAAIEQMERLNYKNSLEHVALALFRLFRSTPALRPLSIGGAGSDEALRLTGFGVHATEYLAFQSFLPTVEADPNGNPLISWEQDGNGHPGNWREQECQFCLNTFLDVATKVQHAAWVPWAVPLFLLYDYRVSSLADNVEVWRPIKEGELETYYPNPPQTKTVHILKKNESLTVSGVVLHSPVLMYGLGAEEPTGNVEFETLEFGPDSGSVFVKVGDVKITCIPRDTAFVKESYPELAEIDWDPKKPYVAKLVPLADEPPGEE
jgi:hypothetical protein